MPSKDGEEGIPSEWLAILYARDLIETMASRLAELGEKVEKV